MKLVGNPFETLTVPKNAKMVRFSEPTKFFPGEGAYILCNLLTQLGYGDRLHETEINFPWGGPPLKNPPHYASVPIDYHTNISVPWGEYDIGEIKINTGVYSENGVPYFNIHGTIDEANITRIHQFGELLRSQTSIYKGKAFKIDFEARMFGGQSVDIHFMNTEIAGEDAAAYTLNDDLMEVIEAVLFAPVRQTQLMRDAGISLKRGVMLEGGYGLGKTLTASMLSREAAANGWTFIYVKDSNAFQSALNYVMDSGYEPAIVFCEDIDKILEDDRDIEMDNILNTIDGIDSKKHELLIVLPTNNIKQINAAMLRPGRIDSVISYVVPDHKSIDRLIRKYAGSSLSEEENIDKAIKKIYGQIPAVIKEIVNRAKMFRIAQGEDVLIYEDDLLKSFKTMKKHLKYMRKAKA